MGVRMKKLWHMALEGAALLVSPEYYSVQYVGATDSKRRNFYQTALLQNYLDQMTWQS